MFYRKSQETHKYFLKNTMNGRCMVWVLLYGWYVLTKGKGFLSVVVALFEAELSALKVINHFKVEQQFRTIFILLFWIPIQMLNIYEPEYCWTEYEQMLLKDRKSLSLR